jgi:hypothetical protein
MAMRFRLTRQQWFMLIGMLLALFLLSSFVGRAMGRARNFHRGPATDEPLKNWMNIPYIAHSYQVPPEYLDRAIGLPGRDRRPIARIAAAQGRDVEVLKAELMAAIKAFRENPPPPDGRGERPPPAPPPPEANEEGEP